MIPADYAAEDALVAFRLANVLDAKLKDGASATYNVELMSSVVAELERISSIVNLDYGTDLPLKLTFEFPEEQRFNFYLAPRIEQ